MHRKSLILFAITTISSATACGGATNNATNASTPNSNVEQNSSSSAPNNAQSADGVAGGQGWMLSITGGSVPDAGSDSLAVVSAGGTLSISGRRDGGAATLAFALPIDGEVAETKEYTPAVFSVTYQDPNYLCNQAEGFIVDLTSASPAQGTFSGPVHCQLLTDFNMNFDAEATGTFSEQIAE